MPTNPTLPASTTASRSSRGFTLIELMIVVAIIAIILTLALPVYSTYTVRAKIGEALSVTNAAVTAVSATCISDRNLVLTSNESAGFSFSPGVDSTDYVQSIIASGNCAEPILTVQTKNTGASPDPVLIMTGNVSTTAGQTTWKCSSTSPNRLLPDTCRS